MEEDYAMIDYQMLVDNGKELLALSKERMIPYVKGGMTLAGMDCQGLCEYLQMQCGLSRQEVNLAGSNEHWRRIRWRGSVEEAVALFGSIPDGAWLFIHEPGYNAKYNDNDGDASHMGQYLDKLIAVHASASKGYVLESKAKNKSINGGWNAVGLDDLVQYSAKVEAILAGLNGTAADLTASHGMDGDMGTDVDEDAGPNVMTSPAITASLDAKRYVRVSTPNGGTVNIREVSNPAIYKYRAPNGTVMLWQGTKGDKYLRVLYNNKTRLVDKDYVRECDADGNFL
jgi:hypothetical protein